MAANFYCHPVNNGKAAQSYPCIPRENMPNIPTESDVAMNMNIQNAELSQTSAPNTTPPAVRKTKKRICRFPGCTRSIKTRGHCQTHGGKPNRCKVPGCQSQRQGGAYKDMCKRHWREMYDPKPKKEEEKIVPVGASVYDDILPASFDYKNDGGRYVVANNVNENNEDSSSDKDDDDEGECSKIMALAKLLQDNSHLEPGWHRRAERAARGMKQPKTIKCNLEEWEAQTAIIEMALLVGIEEPNTSDGFRYQRLLAHAWGRQMNDFRNNLVFRLCSRRGDLSRKQRSDTGKTVPEEKRKIQAEKSSATKAEKRRKLEEQQKEEEEKEMGGFEEDPIEEKDKEMDGLEEDPIEEEDKEKDGVKEDLINDMKDEEEDFGSETGMGDEEAVNDLSTENVVTKPLASVEDS